eukprot:jgi/Chlat1/6293/Chrsp44S05786
MGGSSSSRWWWWRRRATVLALILCCWVVLGAGLASWRLAGATRAPGALAAVITASPGMLAGLEWKGETEVNHEGGDDEVENEGEVEDDEGEEVEEDEDGEDVEEAEEKGAKDHSLKKTTGRGRSAKTTATTTTAVPGDLNSLASYLLTSKKHSYARSKLFLSRATHRALRPHDPITNEEVLPARAPDFSFKTCALVGNSAVLHASRFGPEIDACDAVMRINQAPTAKYERYVGSKTTFRLLNKKWTTLYAAHGEFTALLTDLERNASLVSTRSSAEQIADLHARVRRHRPDARVLVLGNGAMTRAREMLGEYRRAAEVQGANYTGGVAPSSGFLGVYVLLQLCERVTAYGFSGQTVQTFTSVSSAAARRAARGRGVVVGSPQGLAQAGLAQQQAPAVDTCGSPAQGRLVVGRVYAYHYFTRYIDSEWLVPHEHHAFDLELDVMRAFAVASSRTFRLC